MQRFGIVAAARALEPVEVHKYGRRRIAGSGTAQSQSMKSPSGSSTFSRLYSIAGLGMNLAGMTV